MAAAETRATARFEIGETGYPEVMTDFRTIEHRVVREWAEKRGLVPTTIRGTWGSDLPTPLQLTEPEADADPARIELTWDQFFEIFEDRQLAFTYQDDDVSGVPSQYYKFERRGMAQAPARRSP